MVKKLGGANARQTSRGLLKEVLMTKLDPGNDDVLDRLRISLPAPQTCDVIDINPGTGLWSKSLHKLLQPRRHVLVESDLQQYANHLEPLLKRRGSKYRHATNLEEAFDPDKNLLSTYDTEKAGSVGKVPQFNESLLMTVNFSSRKVSQGGYTGSLSKKFFDDLYFSLFSRPGQGLFRYGLIRILAWIPAESEPFVPRTVYRRFKQIITLEATTNITEIAGVPISTTSTRYRRWPELELEEYAVVNARAKGIPAYQVPDSRLDEPPVRELRSINPTPRNLRNAHFTTDATWVPKFLQVEERLKKEEPEFYREHGSGKLHRERRYKTPLQREWAEFLRSATTRHTTHMKAVEVVNQERRLISDWKSAIHEANGGPLDPNIERQLRNRGDENNQKVKALAHDNKRWAEKAIDDCRGLDMSPPVLFWSRRETHPLIVHDGEFEPLNRHMALLDVIPQADLLSKLDTADKMICFRHVMTIFSNHLSKSLAEALKMLVHDAGFEDFAKTVQGINDPIKGGWYDLTQLRLRALPKDMFVEIALAYEKWPFRQRIESILMATPDSQAGYSAEEDDFG